MLLEVCVDNIESALNAWTGGAKRLELCSSLKLGGLTPSFGLFSVVRRLIPPDCAIFVMIRPKAGENYVYSDHDIDVMVEDIRLFKQNGVDGFVFGCLNESKEIDEPSCMRLLQETKGLPSTFHRAFDVVVEPKNSLRTLIRLGFSRVLTSGQAKNALLGSQMIGDLTSEVEMLGSNFIVVAGGGINLENMLQILLTTKVKEYHSSARRPGTESYENYITDQSVVRKMVEKANKMSAEF